jgi:hypothetical protein
VTVLYLLNPTFSYTLITARLSLNTEICTFV